MSYDNITIGADPELFLRNRNGEYVPCIGIVGGTKEEPNYFTDSGHAMQEDNVMLEFNIPPCETRDDFVNSLVFSMDYILSSVEDDLGIVATPSVEFDEKLLEHPQAKVAGCSPFYNAYTKQKETVTLEDTNIRYAGGHIHIGYDNPKRPKSARLVPALDLHLALPSLLLDLDDRRRETYGKAGMFRFKDYGLEYRSLSNFWLQTEEKMHWVYDNTMRAIEYVERGDEVPENLDEIINQNKKDDAQATLDRYGIRY